MTQLCEMMLMGEPAHRGTVCPRQCWPEVSLLRFLVAFLFQACPHRADIKRTTGLVRLASACVAWKCRTGALRLQCMAQHRHVSSLTCALLASASGQPAARTWLRQGWGP